MNRATRSAFSSLRLCGSENEIPTISFNITGCTRWLHLSDARNVAKFPQVVSAGERNGHAEE
jgi:hypothetical protein